MLRLLCWLGLHDWRSAWYDSQTGCNLKCYRCGKHRVVKWRGQWD